MIRPLVTCSVALVLALGCGDATPPPESPADKPEADDAPKKKSGLAISSEIGAMDEAKTTATFEQASSKLQACYSKGAERIPYLGGEIRFVVRVAESGATRWAYVKDSTLGDRKTEDCMLSAISGATWPKPLGGEGLAEKGFTFEPSGDERPPVAWSAEQLGAPFKKAKAALASCRSGAGAGAMKATLYVATNGKPSAVGVSSSDEKGEKAAACVVAALERLVFPSPGSYASKVSVPIE